MVFPAEHAMARAACNYMSVDILCDTCSVWYLCHPLVFRAYFIAHVTV